MRSKLTLLILLSTLLIQVGCLYVMRYDGPYHGKVVDEQTREPIEGAVVLGIWADYHRGVGGGYTTLYDAREIVTDKNGEFTIPGQGRLIMGSIGSMEAHIYKSGYTDYRSGWWVSTDKGKNSSQQVTREGNTLIFPLRKLTDEERRKRPLPMEDAVPNVLMRKEINKERAYRGYSLLPVPGEPK